MTRPASTTTDAGALRLRNAKEAVKFFWTMRDCMPDTGEMAEAIELIREISRSAKAEGRRIREDEWIDMAEAIDAACDDDALPRMFDS